MKFTFIRIIVLFPTTLLIISSEFSRESNLSLGASDEISSATAALVLLLVQKMSQGLLGYWESFPCVDSRLLVCDDLQYNPALYIALKSS